MKLVALVALVVAAVMLTACGGNSSFSQSSITAADVTALAYQNRAEEVKAVGELQAQQQAERRATDAAIDATSTQQAIDATATALAQPTATATSTPMPTATATPLPTMTSTATVEPSATVRVVVSETATVQPVVATPNATEQGPMVSPIAGALGSLVVSAILLLIVLRVLRLMNNNNGS